MILNLSEILDSVTMADLLRYLGHDLKKSRCACPVHNGKDANFKARGRYGTCFSSCGRSWDTVELLQELRNYTFPEAVEELARVGGMDVQRTSRLTDQEKQRYIEADLLRNKLADNLKQALDVYPRMTVDKGNRATFGNRDLGAETVEAFDVFVAPKESVVLSAAKKGQLDQDALVDLGVLHKTKAGRVWEPFADRICMPLHDQRGKVIGLTGRVTATNNSKAKYWNTADSPLFQKGKTLYGLAQNWRNITQFGALLVEGNWDVVTLYDRNIRHAVASCGTAVTEAQLQLLARYTDKLTILMDDDEAGHKAAMRAADLAMAMGFQVKMLFLPGGEDPDGFLRSGPNKHIELKALLENNAEEGYSALIDHLTGTMEEAEYLQRLAELLASASTDYQKMKCAERIEKKLGAKNARWKLVRDLAEKLREQRKEEEERPRFTKDEQEQIERYMLFARGERFYVIGKNGGALPLTNFRIRPVMQVIGSKESRVIMELKNIKGHCAQIEVNTDAMTEIGPFKKECLRRGHYTFDEVAQGHHFVRMMNFVFDRLSICHPLVTLGWNERGKFFAWANGLSLPDGTFKRVDDYGNVEHGDHRFHLPAFSQVHITNPGDDSGNGYENMKDFVLEEDLQSPSIREWSDLFLQVHGKNGMIGIAYYLSCLYRSFIFNELDVWPLLNHFGPPGMGKSFMAQSLTAMFGRSRAPFNLQDGTDVGLFRRIAQVKDGIVFLDEFNNGINPKRFQALKNFYDGAGREKGQKTQDNRTTTTPVTSGIILVGQQQPTQDPALFSRVISLNFGPRQLNEKAGRKLKSIEGTGCLAKITAQLLKHRQLIREQFLTVYDQVATELKQDIPEGAPRNVISRMVKNTSIILSAFRILAGEEEFAFTYDELREHARDVMVKQLFNIGQEDDQAIWWDMFNFGVRKGELNHDMDFLVSHETEFQESKSKPLVQFPAPRKVLFLHLGTAFRVYSRLLRQENKDNGMPQSSIRHYLVGSEAYLGAKTKRIGSGSKHVLAFDMALLPFDLPTTADYLSGGLTDMEEPETSAAQAQPTGPQPDGSDLPF